MGDVPTGQETKLLRVDNADRLKVRVQGRNSVPAGRASTLVEQDVSYDGGAPKRARRCVWGWEVSAD